VSRAIRRDRIVDDGGNEEIAQAWDLNKWNIKAKVEGVSSLRGDSQNRMKKEREKGRGYYSGIEF
jgi:hypothetical protein